MTPFRMRRKLRLTKRAPDETLLPGYELVPRMPEGIRSCMARAGRVTVRPGIGHPPDRALDRRYRDRAPQAKGKQPHRKTRPRCVRRSAEGAHVTGPYDRAQ